MFPKLFCNGLGKKLISIKSYTWKQTPFSAFRPTNTQSSELKIINQDHLPSAEEYTFLPVAWLQSAVKRYTVSRGDMHAKISHTH